LSALVALTEFGPTSGPNYEFVWEGEYLTACLISDVGKKRHNNEDFCLMCGPIDEDVAEDRGALFAVADGMGGALAGEYASRMALHILAESYYSAVTKPTPTALREAIELANERIFEESELNPNYSGMGTTMSALVVLGDWAYIAQVGDSRVYLLRERSGMHQITRDHSLVAEQVRSGLITPDEARNHSLKNLITRAVGIKDTIKIDLFSLRLKRGDTLLLCSDGLCNHVTDSHIAQELAMGNLRAGARRLIERALDGGGTDNITAVTLRVSDSPPKSYYQEGAEEVPIGKSGFFARMRELFS
jgi:protein phosphatase